MKLELYNDLHLEFGAAPPRLRGGEVLCIAGDMVAWNNRLQGVAVLNLAAEKYERVFFVLGNHEYYGAPNFDAVQRFWHFEVEVADNVKILRTGVLEEYGGLLFGGDTLWTDINPTQQTLMPMFMNDCNMCYGLTGQRVAGENERTWKFLLTEKPDVVITHHLPTEVVTTPRWRGAPGGEYFANKYGKAERIGAKLWHFGHTHDNIDMLHEGTRYVCNPYGYYRVQENRDFQEFLEVEL